MKCQIKPKNSLKHGQCMQDWYAPLISYEEGWSTHARWTPNIEKQALDRAYAGPKTLKNCLKHGLEACK